MLTRVLKYFIPAQAVYYTVTGLWPLFHIRSFLFITGDKTDIWLVKTVGCLVAVIGVVLLSAVYRKAISFDILLLGLLSALVLGLIEGIYAGTGRISPVYLADAVIEFGLVVLWLMYWRKENHGAPDAAQ